MKKLIVTLLSILSISVFASPSVVKPQVKKEKSALQKLKDQGRVTQVSEKADRPDTPVDTELDTGEWGKRPIK